MMDGIVVTGASGLVGFRLMQRLCETGSACGIYHSRKPEVAYGNWLSLDLRDRLKTHQVLDRLRPSTIIHCAAYGDPVYCEHHPGEAGALNFGGSLWVSEWASRNDAFLLHLSTDLVFDGQQGNYREEDVPHPISVYGWTKLAAELAVRSGKSPWAIVRTSLVYGRSWGNARGADEKMVLNWQEERKTPLFIDEYRNPTAVGELVLVIQEMIRRGVTGVWHVAGAECVSRFELGVRVADVLGYSQDLLIPRQISEVPCSPPRAPNTTLNLDGIKNLLGFPFAGIVTNLYQEWGQ
jgi:dTDP-4-dehydrorhamnose reductase